MAVVLPSDGSLLGKVLFFLSIPSFWLDDIIMTSLALLTDAVLTSLEIASNSSGGSFHRTRGSKSRILNGFSKFNYFPSATLPNSLFRVGIAILAMAFLTFLAGLLQRFLELLNFLGELREVTFYGITFLTALLSGKKIRFLLSFFFKPMTLTCVVRGICAPVLLAQVEMQNINATRV
jgi:hypothetical protein